VAGEIMLLTDEKTLNILSYITEKAKEIIGERVAKIILYGSYARHTQDNESDMDIMLLIEEEEENIKKYEEKFMNIVFELSLKYEILLSVILKSNKQFNKYLDVLPFYMNVQNEGIEVYGR
jgi:predicted nucleotidyltransferase